MTVSALRRLSIIVSAAMLTCLASLYAQTIQITSPANGAVYSPGQTVAVTVSASAGFSSIFVGSQDPLGTSAPASTAPYQFSLLVPATTPQQQYTITAGGVTPSGQLVTSTPITIIVQRPDSPVSLRVDPSMLKMNIGDNSYLGVWGTYSDGSVAYIRFAASTTFVSNAPAIATVNNYGVVTGVSSGSTTILVNGTVQVPVTVAPAMRIAPVKVALYASQSQKFFPTLSANSSVPSVTWSLNPAVGSVNGSGVYTAPSQVTSSQTVLITATATSNSSISATATITLLPPVAINVAPLAVNLYPSQTVQFSSSLSNTVNYRVNWSILPANVGQIDLLGLYTAPASIASPQMVAATATSTVDGVTAASATINLLPSAVSPPAFSPSAGAYTSAQSVTISTTTPGASIRYTTDGSTPSETAGTLYSSAIAIGSTTTISAIAYESGFPDSAVTAATYTIAGSSTISLVQFTHSYPGNAVTFASNNTPGDAIVVVTSWSGGAPIPSPSLTDALGNTYNALPLFTSRDGSVSMQIWYSLNIASGPNAITVSSNAQDLSVTAFEYSGVAATGALGVTTTADGTSLDQGCPVHQPCSGTATPTSGSFTPSAGSLVMAFLADESGQGNSVAAGSGYTLVQFDTQQIDAQEDNLNAVATAQTAGFTLASPSSTWILSVLELKAASAGN